MTNGRCCSRTIEPNTFTGIGFSRWTFDAVIERLEQHGYVKFEKGKRTHKERFFSRVYIKLKLIKFFNSNGISRENLKQNLKPYIPDNILAKPFIEVRETNSRYMHGKQKIKGRLVNNQYLKENLSFKSQMLLIEEINDFLFEFDFKLPNGGAFGGLKRIYNNFKNGDYQFNHGGRLYGMSAECYQRLPKLQRKKITINNEAIEEVDIHGSFLTITHSLFGLSLPKANNLYDIEGVEKNIAKSWINLSLTNSKPLTKWPSEIKGKFSNHFHKLSAASQYKSAILGQYPFIEKLNPDKHGWGVLQFIESEIILNTISGLKSLNIPAYPAHDSLIVQKKHRKTCEQLLTYFFDKKTGITPILRCG